MKPEPSVRDFTIAHAVADHQKAIEQFFASESATLETLCGALVAAFRKGNKLMICGNGGSTCDAMHVAGEFVGRFQRTRPGLPAIALTADSGIITAVGNDFGFREIFARQVEALGNAGDILIGLSTSGSSENVIAAIQKAKEKSIFTVLMTGDKGRGNQAKADIVLTVPATDTARIQEVHITALHILTDRVEAALTEGGAA